MVRLNFLNLNAQWVFIYVNVNAIKGFRGKMNGIC